VTTLSGIPSEICRSNVVILDLANPPAVMLASINIAIIFTAGCDHKQFQSQVLNAKELKSGGCSIAYSSAD